MLVVFFAKIDCFCFEEQLLQPGERVEMPVTFYVDPEIVNDRDAKYAKSITLSYTFYEIELPQEAQMGLLQTDQTQLNSAFRRGNYQWPTSRTMIITF